MVDPRFPIGPFPRPSAFTSHSRQECILAIEEMPAKAREAVRLLTGEQLQTPYREGGWTLAQVVHHLADSHMLGYARMRLALTETEPPIQLYQQQRWAELHDASSSLVEPSLVILEGLHRRWVDLLRRLTPEQWTMTYRHPHRGPEPVDLLVALFAWHGRHHLAHITTLTSEMGWGRG
jgi:hypothetical protein